MAFTFRLEHPDGSPSGASYGAAKYERLKRLKRAYDSDKVFRLNQNIGPD